MSQYFAALFRRRQNDGWFRAGRYDVTTVDILCGLAVFSMFIYGFGRSTFNQLLFAGPFVSQDFEIWRLFTWPIATEPNIFALISIAFFWSFGQQLEGLMGRNRFLFWVGTVTLVPSIALTALGELSSEFWFISFNFGLSSLFLCGIWLYAGTYPNVRWFEVIPIWALAAVFTALSALQFLGNDSLGELTFLASTVFVALSVGRTLGLATAWPIPHIPLGGGSGGSSGRRRPTRAPKAKRRPKRGDLGQRIVEGPWRGPVDGASGRGRGDLHQPPSSAPTTSPAEQAELDSLLDKIGSDGMDALSSAEKARLNELSKKLRNR